MIRSRILPSRTRSCSLPLPFVDSLDEGLDECPNELRQQMVAVKRKPRFRCFEAAASIGAGPLLAIAAPTGRGRHIRWEANP